MENIEENYKLIAKFRNGRVDHTTLKHQYHASWDWLMPVVEKIELLPYAVDISLTETQICGLNYCRTFYSEDSKIHSVYTSVVEFIKWYNETT